MQTRQVVLGPGEPGQIIRFYFIGDLHMGSIACHKPLIKQMVKQIVDDPVGYAVIMGDLIDAVTAPDKRHSRAGIDPEMLPDRTGDALINSQVSEALDYLRPLKGRILAVVVGNHELDIIKKAEVDPMSMIMKELGSVVPYDGAYCAYLRLKWLNNDNRNGTWRCNMVIHHGAGGGLYIGAKANRIERRAGHYASAHIMAAGHVHTRIHDPNHISIDVADVDKSDSPELKEHPCHCFLTGCTLKAYPANTHGPHYTEIHDYPPSNLGGTYAEIKLAYRHSGESYIKLNGGFYPY